MTKQHGHESSLVRILAAALCMVPMVTHAQVGFVDATRAAGLDYPQGASLNLPIEESDMVNGLGGVCVGDYDHDGWQDLYVTRSGLPNLLFHNQHDATFQERGASAKVALDNASAGCTWVDVDNDGDQDLFVLTIAGEMVRNFLYMNQGDGSFLEQAVDRGVALQGDHFNHVTFSAAFGDIDNDGDQDLFAAAWQKPTTPMERNLNRLLLNDGSGHFSDVTSRLGLSKSFFGLTPGFADVDGDGWVDLLVAADFASSKFFRNLGGGNFREETDAAGLGLDQNGMGAAIADFDNDGDFDWFVTAIFDDAECGEDVACHWGADGNFLYANDGTGQFSDVTNLWGVRDGGWGWGAVAFDFDNDGDLDLAQANGVVFPTVELEDRFNVTPLRLWRNDDNRMTEIGTQVNFDDLGSAKGLVVFDYDRDGDQDVYVANNAGRPKLLRNDGGNQGHWLQLRLAGVDSNRDASGARVRLWPSGSGPVQLRALNKNSNFQSHSTPIVHFGLGGATEVGTVEVKWPATGRVQRLYNVAADQQLQLSEPTQSVAPAIPTGLYWDPAHNGHGLDFQKSGDRYFLFYYTYGEDGTPLWYLATGKVVDGVFSAHADRFDYDASRQPMARAIAGSGGSVRIDFNPSASHNASVCKDNATRRSPRGVFSFSLDGFTGDWCIAPFTFAAGRVQQDFTGSWFDDNDPGWGITLSHQGSSDGQTLVAILYYFDADGNPRWGLGSVAIPGALASTSVDMFQFTGYCPSCAVTAPAAQAAGKIVFSLTQPSQALTAGNRASVDVLYLGPPGGVWQRNGIPIRLLSDPN